MKTYDNVRKIVIGQWHNYTTVYLLGYVYFKNYYKMVAIDFSKQQPLDTDPKTILQIILLEI